MNLLRVDGRPAKKIRSEEQYRAVESLQGMIPWNGRTDNLIDRFDGRALLDFYREPPAASARPPRREEDIELDEASLTLLHSPLSALVYAVPCMPHLCSLRCRDLLA